MSQEPFRRDEATLTTMPPDLAAPDLMEESDATTSADTMSSRPPYGSPTSDSGAATAANNAAKAAGQAVDQAQEKVGQVAGQAQEKVGQAVDQVKQQATSRLDMQKDQAAATLETVAQALRQTGQQLREQDKAPIAGFADQAATQVERTSGYLHGRDVRQMVDETEEFARRQPALFVGGALALGLLAARFLKSSRRTATTPPGQTIPAERALVEAQPEPPDRAPSGAATPTPVRVSSDQPVPAVITDAPTLADRGSY